MVNVVRTDSSNTDFQRLVAMLDADLKVRDGDQHDFYNQFNKITHIKNAIVAYVDGVPVGCGAFREFSPDTVEIKRMYVKPEYRGQGVAKTVLATLEQWSEELGMKSCVLETGKNQPEAIQLYIKTGYKRIPNYGQYDKIENSVCMNWYFQEQILLVLNSVIVISRGQGSNNAYWKRRTSVLPCSTPSIQKITGLKRRIFR